MHLTNTHSPDRLDTHSQNSSHHPTSDDIHDITSEMDSGLPNSITPNMYYPSFPDPNLPVPMMNYPYHPMPQAPMDLTYMLTTNMHVPHNLLVDETPQAGPSGLQNGREYDTSSPSVSPSHYSLQCPLGSPSSQRSLTATPIQSPNISSFPTVALKPVHAHTMLPPMVHPDPNDPASKFGADVRPSPICNFYLSFLRTTEL